MHPDSVDLSPLVPELLYKEGRSIYLKIWGAEILFGVSDINYQFNNSFKYPVIDVAGHDYMVINVQLVTSDAPFSHNFLLQGDFIVHIRNSDGYNFSLNSQKTNMQLPAWIPQMVKWAWHKNRNQR